MRRRPWWQSPDNEAPAAKKITLQSQWGSIAQNWWTERFVSVLEEYGENGRLSRAKLCARSGHAIRLRIGPGEMSIGISCSGSSVRDVALMLPRFSPEVWDMLIETIAGDAALTGSLLTGEFSHHLVDELSQRGIDLIPDQYRSVRAYCHCSDDHNPCIHIAAAWYFLTEVLDEDPWILFLLHGKTREEVISRVNAIRDQLLPSSIPGQSEEDQEQKTSTPPPYDPDRFFSCPVNADDAHIPVPERKVSPILLLGPAPYKLGGKNLADRIAVLYPSISAYAESLLSGKNRK